MVKFTYLGDANLDGIIDAVDFAQLDASWLRDASTGHTGTGFTWLQGDNNYDGVINATDFANLDAAYTASQLGGNLAADPFLVGNAALLNLSVADYTSMVSGQLASNAVPEPTSIALLGLGAVALLRRRR